jgi:hypothetical protein
MKFLVILSLFLLSSFSAFAQNCYSSAEADAERILRIHSELLVIGLNCQHRADLGFPYQDYQSFTQKNASLISHQENVMLRHFMTQGASNPQKTFHEYRTGLANTVAQDAAVRPDGFCAVYGSRIRYALGLARADLMHWMATYPVSRPICGL